MSCDDCIVPEMWFRDVQSTPTTTTTGNTTGSATNTSEKMITIGDHVYTIDGEGESEGVCIASGFATAKYADKLMTMPEEVRYIYTCNHM